MYEATASPDRILPKDHTNVNYYLLSLAKEGRLQEAGPLFVYEALEEYADLVDFVVFDGHHRLEAAKRVDVPELELKVMENGADFKDLPMHIRKTCSEENFKLDRKEYTIRALELMRMDFGELTTVRLNLTDVVPHQHTNISSAHLKLAMDGRLDESGPIRVLETTEDYKELGTYVVIDGHYRLEAAKSAGNKDILAVVIERPEDYKVTCPWRNMSKEEFNRKRRGLSQEAWWYPKESRNKLVSRNL